MALDAQIVLGDLADDFDYDALSQAFGGVGRVICATGSAESEGARRNSLLSAGRLRTGQSKLRSRRGTRRR
jgi:hypothetical protein